MRLKIGRLLPDSLFARLTLVLVTGLLATQLVTLWLHLQERAHWVGMAMQHTGAAGHDWPARFLWHLGLTLLTVVGLALLAVRWVIRPLQQLADAANAFAHDLEAPALTVAGPIEARQAAEAFNFMQQRLRGLVQDRSRALAAVSHDLRTPLTRLRLRVEMAEDADLQARMLADIDTMRAMVDAVLSYLRGRDDSEPVQRIDLHALLSSLVADEQELGRPVHLATLDPAPAAETPIFCGRLASLQRAVANLVDNAVIHGGSATLALQRVPGAWHILVEDAGPGIAETDLDRVMEPFVRLDASRNLATGGVGLGLAIVRDAIQHEGGQLVLANRRPSGLCATLVLPDRR